MKTKNNSQKIVSAKILAKLVELATKCVIPCITTSTPGKYTAEELWQGKDSFGNNVWWSIDEALVAGGKLYHVPEAGRSFVYLTMEKGEFQDE